MTEYHKINALFMRDMSLPNKPLIEGEWASPEFKYLAENRWEFTEKVDGTNIRVEIGRVDDFVDIEFKGRTDNASIPVPLMGFLEKTFTESNVGYAIFGDWGREKLEGTRSTVTLYGEGYGPKIQNGGNYRDDQSFVLFDVKIDGFWLTRENVDDIANKLGIDSVPTLGYGTLWDAIRIVQGLPALSSKEIEYIHVNNANGRGMKSAWGDFEAEGIVARPTVPLFSRQGNRIIAKIKARDFR